MLDSDTIALFALGVSIFAVLINVYGVHLQYSQKLKVTLSYSYGFEKGLEVTSPNPKIRPSKLVATIVNKSNFPQNIMMVEFKSRPRFSRQILQVYETGHKHPFKIDQKSFEYVRINLDEGLLGFLETYCQKSMFKKVSIKITTVTNKSFYSNSIKLKDIKKYLELES